MAARSAVRWAATHGAGRPRRRRTIILRGYESLPVVLGPAPTIVRAVADGAAHLAG